MRAATPKITETAVFNLRAPHGRETFLKAYSQVRDQSEAICRPLKIEDYGVQSMPDVSPPKWHLAHTSWFFERFLLMAFKKGYEPKNPDFHYLFNSYYKSLAPHQLRSGRGLLPRPPVDEVYEYRESIDQGMLQLIKNVSEKDWKEMIFPLELGLHHEQQHQELLLTDIKHILYSQALKPTYRSREVDAPSELAPLDWISFEEGLRFIGHSKEGFAFDNERPSHRVFLEGYRLASRPVINGEYLEFIQDKGYQTPTLWLSDGWDTILSQKWEAPLYWEREGDGWKNFTLWGFRPLAKSEPVCHLSYYEADAFSHW